MRTLALDQSSKCTGYAVFENNNLIYTDKFTFEDIKVGQRLYKIRKKIIDIIQEYKIDNVIFEDIQLQNNVANNVQTFKILAEVYGIIEELLTELNIPYTTVLASTWKSSLNIKGKNRQEQKQNAQKWVIQTYGIKPSQDQCDAICIGAHTFAKKDNFNWA